ncbi:MAG: hypothetical protein H6754_06960 [Candidatus Omnitrophica bacterium]|nr:hypothetical protein [Candidatus Omnitrophota bacterium]
MQKSKFTIKFFIFLAIALSLIAPIQAEDTIPSISGLTFGVVRGACAPWDGEATEIILTPQKMECDIFKAPYPFLRIAINDRSMTQLDTGVYHIDLTNQMVNQISFAYAEGKFQVPHNAILTIQSRDDVTNKLTGELQFTFEDQPSQTVNFEAVICQDAQQPCG